MREPTVETFLKDVDEHGMIALMDNGIYRHLKFRAFKDSWNQWFEIITWPQCLAINGDMGSWTFSRVEDMFTFFRSSKGELKINPSYWEEKVQAENRHNGSKMFDPDTFKANALHSLEGYGLDDALLVLIKTALDDEGVFSESEDESRRALAEFKYTPDDVDGEESRTFKFVDSWEIRGDAYTYHFIWCLYAIVWGIQQYDVAKDGWAA